MNFNSRHTPIQPQCHFGTAMDMDSPANFYDCDNEVSKHFQVKTEPFDIDTDDTHGHLTHFLNSEDSVDLESYLNTGEELLRQIGNVEASTSHRMVNHGVAGTRGSLNHDQHPLTAQLRTVSEQAADQMHFENMPLPQQLLQQSNGHVYHDQTESIVPDYITMEVTSEDSTPVSSPGQPTSPATTTTTSAGGSTTTKRKRAVPDPGTEEYKQKRERNNIAVRKSREKTKQKNQELQSKVGELQGENADLKKRVEMLTKELTVLKSLFVNVGKTVPPTLDKVVK